MSVTMSATTSLCWCQLPVPQELESEVLCVQHFLTTVEHDCSELRREIAIGKTTPPRHGEIADWVKSTANKLTMIAYGRLRLSDEFKKRILTDFLTLMNLHESLDRSANRATTTGRAREIPVASSTPARHSARSDRRGTQPARSCAALNQFFKPPRNLRHLCVSALSFPGFAGT